jgi:hypothetical protein
MRHRSLLRLLVSALCGALLLQPGLLDGATSCASPETVDVQRGPHAHAMQHAAGGSHDAATDEGCRPATAPDQCASAACTAPTVAIVVDVPPPPAAAARAPAAAEPESLESGPDTAPELPPPRA